MKTMRRFVAAIIVPALTVRMVAFAGSSPVSAASGTVSCYGQLEATSIR